MAEYIEREALLKSLTPDEENETCTLADVFLGLIRKIVEEQPAADVVEVRHGMWVEGAEHFTNGLYEAECSECGNYIRWNEGNSGEWYYCPNCGADMRGDKNDR